MMFKPRFAGTAAVALAIAATAVPAASARPIDDGPSYRALLAYPSPIVERTQDLRSPDTRDYAEGRGTYNAPDVVVVKTQAPVAEPTTAGGIDWEDVGIGAAGLLGAILIALGGTLFVVQRRGARAHAAH